MKQWFGVPWVLWTYSLLVAAIGGIVAAQAVFELKSSDWAAWVQAIGSIGAIIGAVIIANTQRRHESERLRKAEASEAVRLSEYVYVVCKDASGSLNGVKLAIQKCPGVSGLMPGTERLEDSQHSLRRLMEEKLPADVVKAVAQMRQEVTLMLRDVNAGKNVIPGSWVAPSITSVDKRTNGFAKRLRVVESYRDRAYEAVGAVPPAEEK